MMAPHAMCCVSAYTHTCNLREAAGVEYASSVTHVHMILYFCASMLLLLLHTYILLSEKLVPCNHMPACSGIRAHEQ
jgi:hypothetical protein